jgi:hypothetical protein
MTTTTISTPSRKGNLLLPISLLLIASAITCLVFFIKPNENLNLSSLSLVTSSARNNVLIYIPNSYLNYLVKKAVLNSNQDIYDKNLYDFYDVAYSNTNGTQKTFILTLIKKSTFVVTATTSEKILHANIESYYSESNLLKKDIHLTYNSNNISIKTSDVGNNEIELFNAGYSDLLVIVSDTKFKYPYSGSTVTYFNNNSIVISYANDDNYVRDVSKYMDNLAMYQNIGASTVFSFDFVSYYTSQPKNQLYFRTGSSSLSDLKLKRVDLTTLPNNKIEAKFVVDNPIFCNPLSAIANLNKTTNQIESVKNYSYNPSSCSSTGRQIMDEFIETSKRYVQSNLINNTIIPKIEGDTISLSSFNLNLKVIANTGRSSYYKNNVISTIDLYY